MADVERPAPSARLTPLQLGVLEAMTRGLSCARACDEFYATLAGQNACLRSLRKRGLLVYQNNVWSITEAGRAAVLAASPKDEPDEPRGEEAP